MTYAVDLSLLTAFVPNGLVAPATCDPSVTEVTSLPMAERLAAAVTC